MYRRATTERLTGTIPSHIFRVISTMLKVHIKNFQSIKDTELVIDGLTIVTGRNNGGKSAAMRAIRGVFTNTRGYSFVRYGESHCEVTITFQDGQTVTWEKGKSVNRYTVNGKVFDKVGTGVPDEVLALGVYPIQVGNQTIWPQVAPQFTGQVFLMDQPGSLIAEAVSDVTRVGVLSKGLKQSEQDRRQTQQDLKIRRQDKQTLESEIAGFEGLDKTVSTVADIEKLATEIQSLDQQIQSLQKLETQLTKAQSVVQQFVGAQSIAIPVDSGIALQAQQKIAAYTRLKARLEAPQKVLRSLAGSENVKAPEAPSDANKRSLDNWTALHVRLGQAQKARVRYAGVEKILVPTIPEGSLKSSIQSLTALQTRLSQAQRTLSKYRDVPSVPPSNGEILEKVKNGVAKWEGVSTRFTAAKGALTQLTQELSQAESAISEAEKAVQEILAQMPQCPTCGQGHSGC